MLSNRNHADERASCEDGEAVLRFRRRSYVLGSRIMAHCRVSFASFLILQGNAAYTCVKDGMVAQLLYSYHQPYDTCSILLSRWLNALVKTREMYRYTKPLDLPESALNALIGRP